MRTNAGPSCRSVAEVLRPVVLDLLGTEPTVALRLWDGSRLGPQQGDTCIVVHSPRALRRLLYSPGELGIARAYVAGELDIEGDVFAVLGMKDVLERRTDGRTGLVLGLDGLRSVWRAARHLGALGPPLPPPPEEARLRGSLRSRRRDAAAIAHHYDVSNDFYRLVVGETMTYSCAVFTDGHTSLDQAQRAKYDLICRKLGLRPGMRLLDVGCGWGGMLLHAAEHYGVRGVGVTLSRRQHELAARRMAAAGLTGQVEVRLQDYRDVSDGPFDAISSIGMFEHVGSAGMAEYFIRLLHLLRPTGRLLNHAISRRGGQEPMVRNSFVQRYVFPDSQLLEVGSVVTAMHEQGFEVRDVEALREHYARTLRHWVGRLEANWDEAVGLVGASRARIWRLYMAGCCLNFEEGRLGVDQVLAVKPGAGGASGMPTTRAEWYQREAEDPSG